MTRQKLVLASSSPYRKMLLQRLGIAFDVRAPEIDETPLHGESFEATAVRLAREKATAIAQMVDADHVVIGSDQVAHCEGVRLDKPGTEENALLQLLHQRGKQAFYHSAVCVISDGGKKVQEICITTVVRFRDASQLTEDVLRAYLAIEKPLNSAGSAKSEGLGIALIESIACDDPTALIGLPLIRLCDLLKNAGIHIFNTTTSAA